MSQTENQNQKQIKKLYYLPGEKAPVIVSEKCAHKKEKVYKFSIVDNMPAIICTGEVDPQEMIDASKGETLSEICARFTGKNPIEKLSNAVNSGAIQLFGDSVEMDTTGFSDNLTENINIMKKGATAAKALPAELSHGATVEEIAKGLTQEKLEKYILDQIKKYQEAQPKASEGESK